MPPVEEIAKHRWIIGAHSGAHRWPRRERLAPARKLRLAGENSEVGDLVERIEIAQHRTEHSIDQRKTVPVKPWRGREARLDPRKSLLELDCLGFECRFVRRRGKT